MTYISLNIPVTIFKEKKAYIAYCPVLDLSTSAKTYEKVKGRFNDVVKIYFDELCEMGTVDEVLSSLGWVKVQNNWSPPLPISNELTQIKVPLCN